jgi:biotin carboxylase
VPRVLLLLPTATYRAPDFLAAALRLGVEVVVGSEHAQALADEMGDRALVVPLSDHAAAVRAILELHQRTPIDAVVAVDDPGIVIAADVSERLGLPHSHPRSVAATRDKEVMRAILAEAGVPQPRFGVVDHPHEVAGLAASLGFPVVVKPTGLSGSRGVIRADDETAATAAAQRIRAIVTGPILVEEYVPGAEVAVEALARGDAGFDVLAVFDKPDPLEGPYFEETIYVTPSRLSDEAITRASYLTARAAAAIGLTDGPVHAEVRVDGDRAWVVEVAARSIGGLCARTLRFGAGLSLEELILRHALGMPIDDVAREREASGVMMLPIPHAGTLREVRGQDVARAVDGVDGLEITVRRGGRVVPLPEGDRYLGFLFARAPSAAEVESALRSAHAALDVVIDP